MKPSPLQILTLLVLCSLSPAHAAPDLKIEFGPVARQSVFKNDTKSIWGGSLVKGEDGLYHMFYSRWPKKPGWVWVSHSEIAHAVSDSPFGPFIFKDVALPVRGAEHWDGLCTHNPTIHKFDSKYYLYHMGNTGDGKVQQFTHLERPQVHLENGKPVALLCAADTLDENKVRHSFNIQIPLVVTEVAGKVRQEQPHAAKGRNAAAYRSFQDAAASGDIEAMTVLGRMHLKGNGIAKSPWIAFGYFMEAATKGNPEACRHLGRMYFNGTAVEQGCGHAMHWWQKGAAAEDYLACHDLAHLLYTGDGVKANRPRAIALWKTASTHAPANDQNSAIALAFAELASGDPSVATPAKHRLQAIADAGNRRALDALKYLVASGRNASFISDIPWIHQARNYCAPASGTMMLRHQGVDASHIDVQRRCPNTNPGEGVYWSNLVTAAAEYGQDWQIDTFAPTEEGFAEAKAFVIGELTAGRPMIFDWFDTTNAHTVLLCGYDEKTSDFFFRDPGLSFPGVHVRSEAWLKENWKTRNYIPNNKELRRALIRLAPDVVTEGQAK